MQVPKMVQRDFWNSSIILSLLVFIITMKDLQFENHADIICVRPLHTLCEK